MRVKFCFLYFWVPSSLSKWKACQISCWESDTQIMSPQTSPAAHVCRGQLLRAGNVPSAHSGTVGHISQILPSKRCRALGQVCNHTQQCRAVPPGPCPSTESALVDTQGDRADPAPGPTPPQPGQECRRVEDPWSLPSPVQNPVPHALSVWMRRAGAEKYPRKVCNM